MSDELHSSTLPETAGEERPEGLRVLQEAPLNAETPLGALASPLTPDGQQFIRNHFGIPALSLDTWRLKIGGEVLRKLSLNLSDLQRHSSRTFACTLECAGNGRATLDPPTPGLAWRHGAVSTSTFTGVPLKTMLELAGLQGGAREVVFFGADLGEVEPGHVESFGRSLPIAHAMLPDVLLVWAMNGEKLTPAHGFPLRLLMPGHYGVASVKWLSRVEVISTTFKGTFQVDKYVYDTPGVKGREPVGLMKVRALIAAPLGGAALPRGPVQITGSAWSGATGILRVAVSPDGGRTWIEAALDRPASPYAATPFRCSWEPPAAGTYTLMARATDRAGNVQPLTQQWNRQGYGNNAVQKVTVTIDGAGRGRRP